MAKQTFSTGQVLTAAQMTSLQQTAMLGGAASAKTASYTLVAADAGTAISMSNAGATTITVNTALFAAGDTVHITNLGAGVCTITAGTATVNSSASLALAQYESGFLDFTSTSAAIFVKGAGAAAAGGGLTLLSTTALSGSSTTVSSISGDYKNLRVVILSARNSQGSNFSIRLNGDTGSNYGRQLFVMQSGTQSNEVAAGGASAINIGTLDSSTNYYDMANVFLQLPEYTNALDKVVLVNTVSKGGGVIYAKTGIAVYDTSSAITSITFFPGDGGTFSAGDILIYGEN
jgi:hypothetical protein